MNHEPEGGGNVQQSDDAIRQYVERLASRFGAIEPPWHVRVGSDCRSYMQMILSPIPSDELAGELVPVIGEDSLRNFYRGFIETNPPLALCIASFLFDAVPNYCTITDGPRIELDREQLTDRLREYTATIRAGDMPILVSLRLANVDISSDFELAPGVLFRKIPEDTIRRKYPVDTTFIGVSEAVAQNWFKHQVEVVFASRGKGKELELLGRHEEHDASVNSVMHAFLMSGLQSEFRANITHYRYDTPLGSFGYTRNVDRVALAPKELSEDHIEKLKAAHRLLENAETDPVLSIAVDRFLIGLDRPSHRPNAANQPNWDKVVDYVIAMESLFLTVNGSPTNDELSYRLRLNGSTLIHLATGEDRRATFHALSHLYSLRSKIVHGNSADAAKPAQAFLKALGETIPNPVDRLRVYQHLRKRVEGWLTSVLSFLDKVAPSDRPYKKQDGWEDLLWLQLSDSTGENAFSSSGAH